MNKQKISEVLEKSVINVMENFDKGYYPACESCGEHNYPMSEMESIVIDDERVPAIVCPKCFFSFEEKSVDVRAEQLDDVERANCNGLNPF